MPPKSLGKGPGRTQQKRQGDAENKQRPAQTRIQVQIVLDRILFGVSHIKQKQQKLTFTEMLATVLNALYTQSLNPPPRP